MRFLGVSLSLPHRTAELASKSVAVAYARAVAGSSICVVPSTLSPGRAAVVRCALPSMLLELDTQTSCTSTLLEKLSECCSTTSRCSQVQPRRPRSAALHEPLPCWLSCASQIRVPRKRAPREGKPDIRVSLKCAWACEANEVNRHDGKKRGGMERVVKNMKGKHHLLQAAEQTSEKANVEVGGGKRTELEEKVGTRRKRKNKEKEETKKQKKNKENQEEKPKKTKTTVRR